MVNSRWYRAVLAVAFVLAAVFAILSQTLQLRAASETSLPEQQIQIGTVNPAIGTFVLPPTPTRTPVPINLGNLVWDDIDQDGRQDAGEPGLPNITVQLWNGTKTWLLQQTTTTASGIYTLTAPLPGNYRIRVLLPDASASFSPKDQGDNDTQDSDINPSGTNAGFTDVISIAPNVISITNIDAGIIIYRTPTPTR